MSKLTVLNWRLVATFLEDHDLMDLLVSITCVDAVDSDIVWRPIAERTALIREADSSHAATARQRRRRNNNMSQNQQQAAAVLARQQQQFQNNLASSYVQTPFPLPLEMMYSARNLDNSRQVASAGSTWASQQAANNNNNNNIPSHEVIPSPHHEPEKLADALMQALSFGDGDGGETTTSNGNALGLPIFLFRCAAYKKYVCLRLVRLIPVTCVHLVQLHRSKLIHEALGSVWSVLVHTAVFYLNGGISPLSQLVFFNGSVTAAQHMLDSKMLLEMLDNPTQTLADEQFLANNNNMYLSTLNERQRRHAAFRAHDPRAVYAVLAKNPWLVTPLRALVREDLAFARSVAEVGDATGAFRIGEGFTVYIFAICTLFGVTVAEGVQFFLWPAIDGKLGLSTLLAPVGNTFRHVFEGAWSLVTSNVMDAVYFCAGAVRWSGSSLASLVELYAPPLFTAGAFAHGVGAGAATSVFSPLLSVLSAYTTTPIASAWQNATAGAGGKTQTWEQSNLHAMWYFPRDLFRGHALNEKLGLQSNQVFSHWISFGCLFAAAVLVNAAWARSRSGAGGGSGADGKKSKNDRAKIQARCQVASTIWDGLFSAVYLALLAPIETFLYLSAADGAGDSLLAQWAKSSSFFKVASDAAWMLMLGESSVSLSAAAAATTSATTLPGGPLRHNLAGAMVHQLLPLAVVGVCREALEIVDSSDHNMSFADGCSYAVSAVWRRRWRLARDVTKPMLWGVAGISLRWGLYRNYGDRFGWKTGVVATLLMRGLGLGLEVLPSLPKLM